MRAWAEARALPVTVRVEPFLPCKDRYWLQNVPAGGAALDRPEIFLRRLGKFAMVPIGLLLLSLAAWSLWSTKAWIARCIETEGTVIEMVRYRDSDNTGYVFAPRVRFETAEGRMIEFENRLRTYPPAYRPRQTVTVLYERDVPESAVIRGFLSLWLMTVILSFIGSIFLLVGGAMVVLSAHAERVFRHAATT
jgi:Protein of unknown function (DUF3592)